MVKLEYVKKRKRKKRAAIIAAICSLGLGVFILVSFLGRFVGTFTVSINTGSVKLSLADDQAYTSPTSYLKLDAIAPFGLTTYTNLASNADEIDNENSTHGYRKSASGEETLTYFKYTFYVKNSGEITSQYDLKVNITKNTPSDDGRYLDVILRVMIYENDADSDEHKYIVYARKSKNPNETYGLDVDPYQEYISYKSPDRAAAFGEEFPGFAEMFETDDLTGTIATLHVPNFAKDDIKRYTIVAWLEGEDQQTVGNEAPEGANLKLGVTINAYENE